MTRRKSNRKKPSGKRISRKLCAMLFWINIMALFFVAWTVNCETGAHVSPGYPMTDIEALLKKTVRTQEEYQTITRQTGLSQQVIDKMMGEGREEEIYEIQSLFFSPVKIRCEPNTIVSREEYLVDEGGNAVTGMHIPDVEEGDILITFCSHTFGWRNGHAALVIDEEKRLTLEAQVLGTPSQVCSLDRWEKYPSFLILRLSSEKKDTRAAIAAYAREYLEGISYRLTAGVEEAFTMWPERNIVRYESAVKQDVMSREGALPEANLSGTQCAHLVWYAFSRFGYDLDSDKGLIVTPADLAESPYLEVVQSYGIEVK